MPPPRPTRAWRHAVLFLLTVVTTVMVGADHYASFALDFSTRPVNLSTPALLLNGLWYSASILAILGAHEFGHYFACRYYGVDASLPYFLPMPVFLTGTLGAVIRIREPIPDKRALFDIGVAGPIAGFVVAVPVLIAGLSLSRVVEVPANVTGLELGEPILFKSVAWLFWGNPPDGYAINMHPMAFAAWFGLLATAFNLFPIGQLDGGHISYAVLGPRSSIVTVTTVAALVCLLAFVSTSWLGWTVLMLVMLWMHGLRHPPMIDEDIPLDKTRLWLAAAAALMFVLCFTPAPIEPLDIVRSR